MDIHFMRTLLFSYAIYFYSVPSKSRQTGIMRYVVEMKLHESRIAALLMRNITKKRVAISSERFHFCFELEQFKDTITLVLL